jgi:tRNA dimethylallyltransferase
MFDVRAFAARPKPVLLIAGATATGKSRFALDVAQQVSSIIINADSMQVYDAIPILTAQPTAEERACAPHALYGTLKPHDVCSAARWAALAKTELQAAWASKALPIVVGGTGLYLRSLLEGLSPIPDIDPAVRSFVRRALDVQGSAGIKSALREHDPALAERLDDNDTQRLCRALEVVLSTGTPLSVWQKIPPTGGLQEMADVSIEKRVLELDRATLYQRCNDRLEEMLKHGALDELQELLSLNLETHFPVMRAVGVPALTAYLSGNMVKTEAIELAKRDTRRFAKRQLTWLRNQFGKWSWQILE